MHPSMFNDFPDLEGTFKACCGCVVAIAILAAAAGIVTGYVIWR